MSLISDENLNFLKKDQILIGVLNPYLNEKKLKEISSNNIKCFSWSFCQELQELNQWIFYHLKQT